MAEKPKTQAKKPKTPVDEKPKTPVGKPKTQAGKSKAPVDEKLKTPAGKPKTPAGKPKTPMAEKPKKRAEKAKAPEALTGTVPEWANSTAIAQLLGKTTRRIQQLTQDGVLETEVPPGGGARKYKTCDTIGRYIAYVEEKAQEVGSGGKLAELNLKKLTAEVELKESQGTLHKLKTAIQEGKYIPADQATEELTEFMEDFRRFLNAIPARISGTMAGYTDTVTARAMEKSMRGELEDMLSTFVGAATAIVETRENEL